jgi:type I restriction enzyme R subunit
MLCMITEDQLEQLCLTWFAEIGYSYVCGYDIAPDGASPERSDYRQIILPARLLSALQKINPHIPAATLEQVALQIAKPETPILIKNNKAFHQLLLEGVKVEFKSQEFDSNGNAESKIDYVQLIDFANTGNNEFLVVNQYSLAGSKGNRRPDVLVFINGIPLAVLELKIPPIKTPISGKRFSRYKPIKKKFPICLFLMKRWW